MERASATGFLRTSDQAIQWFFIIGTLTVACLMPMQNDSWWHLRAGKEMVARGFIMLSDEFSFTVPGAVWPNHEWLSEVVFYAVYAIGGLPFLTFFAAAIISAAVFMSWRLMKGDATDRLILMCLALTSMVPVWTVRPHVFTLFLVMAVVHLSLRRQYWPIPLIFVLWANLHGGVAMGLVVLGGVLVGRLYVMGRDEARRVAIVLAASTAATFLTPLGVSLWTTIPESIHKSSVNQIVEWSFASPLDGTYTAFWLLVVVFSATTLVSWRRIRSDEHAVLVAVAFALLPLALRSRRNIPPFMLIAVPALTHNLALSMANWGKRRDKPLTPLQAKVTTLFLALSMAASILVVGAAWRGPSSRLQWQPLPPVVIAGVEKCERVFNRYPDGGPLIWFAPGVRVFIDSRQDPYPLSFTQEYVALDRSGEYSQMFTRYGVQCALLPENSLTSSRLKQDGWQTRVASEGWLVLSPSE